MTAHWISRSIIASHPISCAYEGCISGKGRAKGRDVMHERRSKRHQLSDCITGGRNTLTSPLERLYGDQCFARVSLRPTWCVAKVSFQEGKITCSIYFSLDSTSGKVGSPGRSICVSHHVMSGSFTVAVRGRSSCIACCSIE